ncbi:hypothetical protein GF336_04210 [Candidatus Woesearchaeota archaeon]|nr:hypothetical protein [Candidatus Woesearchaeota archaeon]
MALGKKGVFFTFVAVVFLSLLIFSLSVGNNYRLRQRTFALETRIDSMSKFISNIENDMERGIYISGFRALICLEEHVIENGEYLDDLDSSFREMFFNGTVNSTNSSLMINNTFTDWMENIKTEADKIDIILNISVKNISLYHDNPWQARIDVEAETTIHDKKQTSSWTRDKNITAYIDLEGFEDPFYRLGTNGLMENRIERKNHSQLVLGTDISNLLDHCEKGDYIAFSGAPSFLMRLEGNFSESEYGIESLVDIEELELIGLTPKDKSIVDHIYFGAEDPDKYHIQGAPSWFELDNGTNMNGSIHRHEAYEVEDIVG